MEQKKPIIEARETYYGAKEANNYLGQLGIWLPVVLVEGVLNSDDGELGGETLVHLRKLLWFGFSFGLVLLSLWG
jgi:hypothetical protein